MSEYIVKIYNETEITYWGTYKDVPTEIFPKKGVTVSYTDDIREKIDARKFTLIEKELKVNLIEVEKSVGVEEVAEESTIEVVKLGNRKK